jgi:hypothetical protein
MIPLAESVFEGNISGYQVGTQIQYRILAYDKATNTAIDDNAGQYLTHAIIPEFHSSIVLIIIAPFSIAVVLVFKSRKKPKPSNHSLANSLPCACALLHPAQELYNLENKKTEE